MSNRKNIKTKKEQIVSYWTNHEDECGLSVDFAEAHERCWRCGHERGVERCHIVPDSLGGEDTPANFVLLCKRCHLDNPNVADTEVMWDWLRAYAVPFYDTFWNLHGIKEYERIYGISFQEELNIRNISDEHKDEVLEILKVMVSKTSYHFGDPHLNIATLAGVYRMILKEYDLRHGLKTEKHIKPYINVGEFYNL